MMSRAWRWAASGPWGSTLEQTPALILGEAEGAGDRAAVDRHQLEAEVRRRSDRGRAGRAAERAVALVAVGLGRGLGEDLVAVGDRDAGVVGLPVTPEDQVGRLADRGHRDQVDQMVEVVDVDPVESQDDVAHDQAGLRPGESSLDGHESRPRGDDPGPSRAPSGPSSVELDAQGAPADVAVGDELAHDPLRQVDRDAEADPLVAAAVGGDRVVDPDDLALHVHQRPARVARVDRGVGLEEVLVLDVLRARPCAARGR